MKLSTRARYAVRMMVEIAGAHGPDTKVSISQVARSTGLSRKYLEQLAIGLRKAGLITGTSGKGGGYVLAARAEDVRVGQVVEAVIGPINIVECVLCPEMCIAVDYCSCRSVYKRINDRIVEAMNDFSLADLVSGSVSMESAASD